MKKNLIAIETAAILILIGMLITGIILKNTYILFISISMLMVGGIGIAVYKIILLCKEQNSSNNLTENPNQENANNSNTKKSIFTSTKNAWEFSTIGEKIKSIGFIVTFTSCCIAFMILCSYGKFKPALITIFVGIALIIIAIIIVALIEKYLITKYKKDKTKNLDNITNENNTSVENIDNIIDNGEIDDTPENIENETK